jgi:predicted  nucleic acid-binding Zn-ribbon protein
VQDQLRLLTQIQELELAIQRFEAAIIAKPRELESLIRACEEAHTAAVKCRQELDDLDKQRRQLEVLIADAQSTLQKAQRKLLEVKTNKEYSAMLSEIDTFKKKISDHEDAVLHQMEAAETRRNQLLDLDRQIAQEETQLAEGRQRNEAELAVLQRTLAERRQQREMLMQQVERPVQDLYMRLLKSRKGLAVVGIQNGSCQGCSLALPPQLMQEVRRNDRVLTCSHCQRILYWNGEARLSPSESGASELVR